MRLWSPPMEITKNPSGYSPRRQMAPVEQEGWTRWPPEDPANLNFSVMLWQTILTPHSFQINAHRLVNLGIKSAQRSPSWVGIIWIYSVDFGVLMIYSGWGFFPDVLHFIEYYTVLNEILLIKNILFFSAFFLLGSHSKAGDFIQTCFQSWFFWWSINIFQSQLVTVC